MKNYKCFLLTFLAVFLFVSVSEVLARSDPYGPRSRRLGVGLHVGEPMAATIKGYLFERLAIQGMMGYSLAEEGLNIIADATYDIMDVPIRSGRSTLPFYAGVGFKLGFDEGGADDGETIAALRFPLGLSLQLRDDPLEFFLELGPGVQFTPNTDFDMTGGVGARYYFF